MEYEFEAKALISKQEFALLLNNLQQCQVNNQINNYLDTKSETLRTSKQALRLRKINDTHILSLKEQAQTGAIEYNTDISPQQYAHILDSQCVDSSQFNLPFSTMLTDLTIVQITTTRYICKYKHSQIELDMSDFGSTIDYEIEIEAENMEVANQLLAELQAEFDLNLKKSYPKIARFYQYL